MIVDSSALLAVLYRESDADLYQEAILTASPCRMSVANLLEVSIVVESRGGAEAGHELDAFLAHAEIEPAAVTAEHLEAARQAWRRFGKGRHPAALNFGDCFAYALARVAGEPLLFKGDDFAHTDIQAAMPPQPRISGT
ncbi:MAG: type II toxin-antitoxin system VapC family toxin [Gammaproteobacteria bacterium]|nr:type II toxin-antitoxin system VapC family toxin [Gammaproteobacteria bacterium]MCY3989443.1 type II toxin-antitoxin system VapC family toxin [Gammaproteobacteria bacterium]